MKNDREYYVVTEDDLIAECLYGDHIMVFNTKDAAMEHLDDNLGFVSSKSVPKLEVKRVKLTVYDK
ncbi:MAG TPA: hypothetical protein PLA71_01080 [Saccharofermentans sp.]|nr:hypothetical protein [Saccharofermentans sp.]